MNSSSSRYSLGERLTSRPSRVTPAFLGEEAEIGVVEHLGGGLSRAAAAQQGPAAGHQLPQAEGLDQVVVGAHLQPQHPVGLTVTGADHQDGGLVAGRAQLAAEIQSPQARQHQIEHHQGKLLAWRALLQGAKGLPAVATGRDGKPFQGEDITDRFTDRVVILDDQEGELHAGIIRGCGGQIPELAQRRGR